MLSLAPSIIILTTSFLRIAIVIDFVRRALSLQQVPPTQVLMGIALFMTVFIMWPTLTTVYEDAFVPLAEGEIGFEEAYREFEGPCACSCIARWRTARTRSGSSCGWVTCRLRRPSPTYRRTALIPAFILHELTVAFKIGILLYIPFIVIDMVVASTLMSMGMIMLPPIMISLPFKLILFVLVDGWTLLSQQLVASFGGF